MGSIGRTAVAFDADEGDPGDKAHIDGVRVGERSPFDYPLEMDDGASDFVDVNMAREYSHGENNAGFDSESVGLLRRRPNR